MAEKIETVADEKAPFGTTIKFHATTGTDTIMKGRVSTSISVSFECITIMKEYENKSLEELRFEDYITRYKLGGFNFNSTTQSKRLFGTTTTDFSRRNVGELSDSSRMRKAITWKIPNFFSLLMYNSLEVSPAFTFANATWCLHLLPYTEDFCRRRYVGLKIKRLNSRFLEHWISYRLSILCIPAGCYKTEFESEHLFNEHFTEHGMAYLIEQERICDERNIFAPNDVVTVFCEMNIKNNIPEKIGIDADSQTESPELHRSLGILCENFRNLLLNGQDHDLILKVKDKEFRAHQNILRARSQVLESMLSHDMIEKNSGVVSIPDCDPKAFEQFLLYLYTGKSESLDQSYVLQLYYVADKYNMVDLKEECRQFIQQCLSSLVIYDVIELALNHCDTQLLKCATEYFIGNADAILPTVEWQLFLKKNPTLANELVIKAVTKLSEKLKI